MAEAVKRLEINELRDKLTAFLNKVGISGSADVNLKITSSLHCKL